MYFYLQSYAFILSFILGSYPTVPLEGPSVGSHLTVPSQGSAVESHLRVPPKGPGSHFSGIQFS